MENKVILGIDVSKQKLDVCLLEGDRRQHKIFQNTAAGFKKIKQWVESIPSEKVHVCLEATGWYSEAVCDYLFQQQYAVSLINPARIKAFSQSRGCRLKTDKSDAYLIALFCQQQNPALWQPLSENHRKVRQIYRSIQALKNQQRMLQNRLERDNLLSLIKREYRSLIKLLQTRIDRLQKTLLAIVREDDNLQKAHQNLISIKGVSDQTAFGLLAELPDLSQFERAKELAAFAGLNPAQRSSGSSLNGKAHISEIGSAELRKLLYMPSLVIKNRNEHFAHFCQKLQQKGKPPKVIIIAVMRKLLHIIFGILKHHQPFNPMALLPYKKLTS